MLSIITPVYNGDRFIEACINVVIEQSCSDVEHIIVDGGSKDSTVEIVKQYAKKFSHIRWISEKDKGQSDAMNKGIAMARGEVLGILNADDFYEANVLNRVLGLFKHLPEPSLLVGNCNVWGSQGERKFVNQPKKLKLVDLLLGDEAHPFPINPSAYFYHASLHQQVGLYSIEDHYAMDLDFLLRAVQVAHVKYTNETFGNFRLIENTKTFQDSIDGQGEHRKQAILKYYRKDLSLTEQYYISIAHPMYEMKKQAKRLLKKQWKLAR